MVLSSREGSLSLKMLEKFLSKATHLYTFPVLLVSFTYPLTPLRQQTQQKLACDSVLTGSEFQS